MWHIRPIPNEEAQDILRQFYDQDLQSDGYVANTSRVWSYRPDVGALMRQVQKAIRSHMRLRTFELITLATARTLGCVY